MSDLQLQAGEYYERRDGQVDGPVWNDGSNLLPWRIGKVRCYACTGRLDVYNDHPNDLIAHIPVTDPRHPRYAKPDESKVKKTLHRWLCVSYGTVDPANWAVWTSNFTSSKPPFAVKILSTMEVEVPYPEEVFWEADVDPYTPAIERRNQIAASIRAIPVGEARCVCDWIVLRISISAVVIGFQTVSFRSRDREENRMPIRRAIDAIWRTDIREHV